MKSCLATLKLPLIFPKEKEVVTVRDEDAEEPPMSAVQAAASRHRLSEDDDGEIEAVLEIYSPRTRTAAASASPSKRRSSRRLLKKQSTLESEFRMKEVIMCGRHMKSVAFPYEILPYLCGGI